jgi:holo-[acyl-carrier protein] synthase
VRARPASGAGQGQDGDGRPGGASLSIWKAGTVIVGIGVDIVAIARLESALRRTPALVGRLFTEGERGRGPASLAGCFAAKEAVAKALAGPAGLRWTDVEVGHDRSGRPVLSVRGTAAEVAASRGVRGWQLSISHDAGLCIAMVVAEG